MPLMAEGEFALVSKRLDRALGLSGQPVKRGTMAHEHIVYMMLVDSMCIAEDREGIEAFAPRLIELAERDDHQPYLAVARRALGAAAVLAGDLEKARPVLNAALEVFEARGMDWQTGRTLTELGKLELGKLKLARGSGEQAEAYFTAAVEAFERIGAGPFVQAARAMLRFA